MMQYPVTVWYGSTQCGHGGLMYLWKYLILLVVLGFCSDAGAEPILSSSSRFFHSGDGRIHLRSAKTGAEYQGRYRIGAESYDPEAYEAICRVFGAPCISGHELSLRLIEFIDALEDHFNPGTLITIASGYRSPRYHAHLRAKGSLAAKASLHQYGMAADLKMAGVSSRRIWMYVKQLGFGGAGYYHGKNVHIDVGPARSWDEKSSGVGSGISDDNQLIDLVTDFDIYRSGEPIRLRFTRMTAFPIGVQPEFSLFRLSDDGNREEVLRFVPGFIITGDGPCLRFGDIGQMDAIQWVLPAALTPGDYSIGARFCNSPWSRMPIEVHTAMFRVTGS